MTRSESMGESLLPGDSVPQRVSPLIELGATGLRRVSGYVEEEFLPQLRGRKAVQVFREMSDNDPIVGALLFAIEKLLREIEWRVEPASTKPKDKEAAEFVEQCMDDMSHTWDDLLSEILTMLPYGWAWHEIVYKKRIGPWEKSGKTRSKYTDGKIGWRKIPIRSQETLLRWVFDDTGGVQAMVQMSPPDYKTVVLPIEKCLLFRPNTVKGNPEGRSILRNAYRPWFMKKRLEEIEAIGAERDLAGMPVGRVPAKAFSAPPGSPDAKMLEAFKKMVKAVRRDEQEGIVLPSEFDGDTKSPLYDFELLSSGGTRQFDTSGIIGRYEQRILMTVLADFILVGHEGTGSYALHTDKSGLFRTSINSIAQLVADVFNRHAIPRLFAANGWRPDELPRIVPNDVDPPDLTQLGGFMQQMAAAGMTWFPDSELEQFIRDAARLPKMDEESEAAKEMESRQAEIMRVAQGRMEMLQLQMQAQQGAMGLQQQQMQLEAPQADPTMDQQAKLAMQGEAHAQSLKQKQEAHQLALRQQRDAGKQKLTQDRMAFRQKTAQARQAPKKPPAKGSR